MSTQTGAHGMSTTKCEIVPATALHAAFMDAMGFRQADVEEWVGGLGRKVLPGLLDALEVPGSKNETFLLDGVPLCMWGTHPATTEGVGIVWLLATKAAERHVLAIHRHFGPVLKDMHSRYPVLYAMTHPRNTTHHRWMERNGFVKDGMVSTALGIPYYLYVRRSS